MSTSTPRNGANNSRAQLSRFSFPIKVLACALLSSGLTHAQAELPPKWSISVLGGGWSSHLSDEFEPEGGYNEWHESIGIHVEQAGDGWVFGAMASRFLDSFGQVSYLGGATVKYLKTFSNDLFLFGGLTAGYINTSYYAGAAGTPFAGIGYQRLSINVIYLPCTEFSDELLVGLVSLKVFEW